MGLDTKTHHLFLDTVILLRRAPTRTSPSATKPFRECSTFWFMAGEGGGPGASSRLLCLT